MKRLMFAALLAVTAITVVQAGDEKKGDAKKDQAKKKLNPHAEVPGKAHGADGWNYLKHGADWAKVSEKDKTCDVTKIIIQSPIDLYMKGSKGFKKNNLSMIEPSTDNLKTSYSNQVDRKVMFNGHTSQVNLDVAGYAKDPVVSPNVFTSSIPKVFWNTKKPMTFEAQQFHFHAGSEHTIDGKRQDLEMHTVHYNKNKAHKVHKLPDAALGIFFSVKDFTAKLTDTQQAIIDNFFDSLQWQKDAAAQGNEGYAASTVAYGNLMNLVDWNNRWVYQGSVTTPPCETIVYWNVLSTVYPIKEKYLKNFKAQLKSAKGYVAPKTLDAVGNWRAVSPLTPQHDLKYVFQAKAKPAKKVEEKNTALIVVIGVLGFLTFTFFLTTIAFYTKVSQQTKINNLEGGEREVECKQMDKSENDVLRPGNETV